MAYEQKDNSGSLFVNDKEKDGQPDRTGSCVIAGREYWVSGWLKKTQAGVPWLSLAFRPKEQQQRAPAPRQQRRQDEDDGPPF